MTTIVVDMDWIKYTIAGACEKRSIIATHKQSGRQKEFNTRTEFWGNWRKKDGGWLATTNAEKGSSFKAEDFDILDVQTPDPIENALHSCKVMVDGVMAVHNTKKIKAFIGRGSSFRVGLSTILEYKGNRKDTLKPLLIPEIEEYIVKKYKAEIVTELEADDVCVMECYKKDDHILCGAEKDYWAQPVLYWNYNESERGVVDCNDLGKLWLNEKGDVKGYGRLFMYWQISSADDVDNYCAHSASDVKWGPKKAYDKLKDCYTDREAFHKMAEIYRFLYPEPKIITGWRGDEFEIDWKYVFEENFHMAKMKRFVGDDVDVWTLLKDFGCLTRDEVMCGKRKETTSV